MTSETLDCNGVGEGEGEVTAIGKAPEKTFSFLLIGRNWDTRPVVSFMRCDVTHFGGVSLSYFLPSITLYWPASVEPERPVQPLTVYTVYFSFAV